MIVKMKFVSATGPKESFDKIVDKYLSKYDLHLESAFKEYESVGSLSPYQESNPYKEVLARAEELVALVNFETYDYIVDIDTKKAIDTINELSRFNSKRVRKVEKLKENLRLTKISLDKIKPFVGLGYDIERILKFQYTRFRFGRIPKPYWNNFATHFKSDLSSIFAKCLEDDEYIWGVYFVPRAEHDDVDTVYESMHFERIYIPDEYEGTPAYACGKLEEKINELSDEIKLLENEIKEKFEENKELLYFSYNRINSLSRNFDVRKMSACTTNKSYFLVCGWMPEKDAIKLEKQLEHFDDCIMQIDDISIDCNPPTILRNPKIFRPFEMYIKMYGLPSYNEFDPTIFVALTYAFIFGAMFGDLGQGFLLFMAGFILYKVKDFALGAIISAAGFFSMIFGLLFGSIFGFEDIIEPLWLRPISSMSEIPFLGKLNTVFIIAIGFGMFLILVTMILNIINSIKRKDIASAIFDTNGLAGLIFYGSIIAVITLVFSGNHLPGIIVLLIMFVLPLLLIGLKEPLTHIIEKKHEKMEESKGIFLVQMFFELFEVLLSYFSNTISFVRIGAFAVSHAAIMEVVFMLAGAEHGSPNIFAIIIGNIIVMGLEGLIVGIQVLRLDYYELFSRFYRGSGRTFKSFKSN